MKWLKYMAPIGICLIFVLLSHKSQLIYFFPFLLLLNQGNKLMGEFNESELTAELIYFHGNQKMRWIKFLCGLLLGIFNIWCFYFITNHNINFLDFTIFIGGSTILNATCLLSLAHDLIHDSNPLIKRTGQMLLFFVAMPFFCYDHLYGHHQKVGTKDDLSSSKYGQSLYNYFYKVIPYRIKESFFLNHSYPIEIQTQIQSENIILTITNFILLFVITCLLPNNEQVIIWFILQATGTYILFEISNYIQHYGLLRTSENQELEINHAWDYYNKYTNYISFLVPLHSYHHMDFLNQKKQPLCIDKSTKLPYCYYRMILLALVPNLWFKKMNPLVQSNLQMVNIPSKKSRQLTRLTAILALVLSVNVCLAQSNVGIKYFGFSIHPKGDEQAHLMPHKLDQKGVFVPNIGTILSFQKNLWQDFLSIKVAQGIYTDSGALLAGHTHVGFRLALFQKNKHLILMGFGPTLIYRRNWRVKSGYEPSGLFKEHKNIQYKFVWYGGEIEYNYQISKKVDLSINFLPGYPVIMSFGAGIRYWY